MGLIPGLAGMLVAVQGAVVGTVRDGNSGAPLAGAVVALPDADRTTLTSSEGRYALPKVPAGPQHLTVRMIGYAARSLHALVPSEGRLEINVLLRAEPTRLRTVEVRAPVALRGLDDADTTAFPDRGLSMAAVANHPLLSEPDALHALAGGEIVVRPESPTGVHVRGGAADHTAYVLDGIPIFNPYHAAGVFTAWNPDALARVGVSSASPSFTHPHALSGAVAATTRAPADDRLYVRGAASTTNARLTVDGPLGRTGAGFLVAIRSGFPGAILPGKEASYLQGELGDWIAKVEMPLFGGQARVLGYSNENELDAAALVPADDPPNADVGRNTFEWRSQSIGGEWRRAFASAIVRLLGWSASSDASSQWAGGNGAELLSRRHDKGLTGTVERAATVAGVRLDEIATSYRVSSTLDHALDRRAHVVSAFVQHTASLHERVTADLGLSAAAALGGIHPGARLGLRWLASERGTLSVNYARTHQFAQSLRNSESVVGTVFPADLYVAAGTPGVPVARSEQLIVSGDYRPSPALRVGVQGYARVSDGLVIVAPRETAPFAAGTFIRGSGSSGGVSLDFAVSRARYGLLASYGWQRVRMRYGDSSYVPDYATSHLIDGGAVVFPTPTTSIRVGASAGIGRRTSVVTGGLEWESCNLLDQGCEFAGSPHNEPGAPAATALPTYLRLDVGIRKHWHLHLGARDVTLAAFGTVTNVVGRRNTFSYARNPSTGEISAIGMRPLSPLVIGLDWRF
jgi:carboxypeptidase family protein